MIQVVENGPSVHELPRASEVIETVGEIGILAPPPNKSLVVAINSQQILPPDPQIATEDATLLVAAFHDRKWQTQGLGYPGQFSGEDKDPDAPRGWDKLFYRRLLHKSPASLDPGSLFGQGDVIGDKLTFRHAVAIEKDQIVSFGHGDSLVQNHSTSEPLIFLPAMSEREIELLVSLIDHCLG